MRFFIILVVIVFSFAKCDLFARIAGHLVITAVQIETAADTKDEFIEIYNPTGHTFDATKLSLKIRDDKKKLHHKTKFIPPYSFYLLASDKFSGKELDATFTAGLAEDSWIELSYADNLIDKLGWGKNVQAEGTSCASPKKGKIIQRKEIFLDTDNNQDDFVIVDARKPRSTKDPPQIPPYARSRDLLPNTIKLMSQDGQFNYATHTTENSIIKGFGIYPISYEKEKFARAGDVLYYAFNILNSANATDTFAFNIESTVFPATLTETKQSEPLTNKTLAAGATFTFYLKVGVPSDAIIGEESTTKIVVKNQGGSGTNDNRFETDTVSYEVKTKVKEGYLPKVTLEKTADKYTCQSGDVITYTLSVKNGGEKTLYNIAVVDELPKQTYLLAVESHNYPVQYYVGESWQEEFSHHATKVKITIPQLPPDATLTFSIKVKVY